MEGAPGRFGAVWRGGDRERKGVWLPGACVICEVCEWRDSSIVLPEDSNPKMSSLGLFLLNNRTTRTEQGVAYSRWSKERGGAINDKICLGPGPKAEVQHTPFDVEVNLSRLPKTYYIC